MCVEFQLSANILILVWTNAIGLYVRIAWEQTLRTAFLDTRNCLGTRHDVEEANNRLDRLLSSALPDHVVAALRTDIGHFQRNGHPASDAYIQKYDGCSLVLFLKYCIERRIFYFQSHFCRYQWISQCSIPMHPAGHSANYQPNICPI